MPSTTRKAVFVTGAVALLLAAGCTTTVPGVAAAGDGTTASTTAAGATPPAAGDPVAWVDGLCGGLLPFVKTAATQPPLDVSSDAAALVKGLSGYLAGATESADSAIKDISALGPSPITGGDDIARELVKTLTTFRTTFGDAQKRVDAVDPTDTQALADALPAAIEPLGELANLPDPTADLKDNPELDRAAEQAPRCKEIESATG